MIDEECIELIEEIVDEEMEEDEAEEISKALDKAEIEELKDALKVFSAQKDELGDEINEAVAKLTKLVAKLAGAAYGYKPKEGEEGEKIKKSYPPWSFTFNPEAGEED